MPLIEVRKLYKRYGETEALRDISIAVDRGEVFTLIGPTGAGKSTLLRLIDLLEAPTSGRIYFDGVDVTGGRDLRLETRRKMAFILQKPVVFNASVYDNVAYALGWRGKRRSDIKQRVNSILELVGLSAEMNRNARTLSGGEVQRVAIARAIAVEPEVLLLDEPMANLDPISTLKIEELISRIMREYETTIIMATHDMAQGQRLASRIGVLVDGEILQTGDPREVFSLPQNRTVAEFVGMENIIDGVITSGEEGVVTIEVRGNVIEAVSNYPVGDEVCACIRPENITLTLSDVRSSARNSFSGEITRLVLVGSIVRVELDCGFQLVALVTKRSADELDLRHGTKIHASFKATGVHVIKKGD